ncbi:LexA family protein [Thiomicrorhabdus aquaedulcis]|uniref:LexA family protein n=1 Tax=Thiomicrorhabdus aquaedulcis TaxID=2211106 RepID=UPI000FD7D6A2|nr:translesion error-prone DNA polymerase V autoproteolytic subunit [Thiomicrorhabdus aquaedulcis]
MVQSHGGSRSGAGRKKGSGRFGEATKVVRVPESKVAIIKSWLAAQTPALGVTLQSDLNASLTHQQGEWQDLAKANAQVFLAPSTLSAYQGQTVPLYSHKVVAGFPSPADDYVEAHLNLNDKLIKNKDATFLLKVQGDSMKKIGIFDGDILVVDKSLKPTDGKIVIAALDGELTVKRLSLKSTGTWLVPENDQYPPIPVKEGSDIVIWGVVTSTIRQF